MHAEFESECKKKIERLANAVKDPSSLDEQMPPAAEQANAQPLASPSDPISENGGAEPCKSQMANAPEMDAHLPRPHKNHSLKKPEKPIQKKKKQNLRHSSFTGGKQVKKYGEQNA